MKNKSESVDRFVKPCGTVGAKRLRVSELHEVGLLHDHTVGPMKLQL
jgi:hypothetical protein